MRTRIHVTGLVLEYFTRTKQYVVARRELVAGFPGRSLEKVVQVQEIGSFALRVETSPDDLPRLEEVLDQILPTGKAI
jgi:hypothetical protein